MIQVIEEQVVTEPVTFDPHIETVDSTVTVYRTNLRHVRAPVQIAVSDQGVADHIIDSVYTLMLNRAQQKTEKELLIVKLNSRIKTYFLTSWFYLVPLFVDFII